MTGPDIFMLWFIVALCSSFEYARHCDKHEKDWDWGLFGGLFVLAPLTGPIIFGKWAVELLAWGLPWIALALAYVFLELPVGIFKALGFVVKP